MKTFLALLIGKLIAFGTRFLKIGGGSAAPGLYALKMDPNLVEKLALKIPKNIIITGTNGKTTTARMLTHFAKESGLKVIRNQTGSNLERGVASALINNFSLTTFHLSPCDLSIWELDEAVFNSVAPKLKPDVVVFLNVFRDQLDRYGEIDSLVKGWCATLKKLDKKTVVLINGDDTNLEQLPKCFKGKVERFGLGKYKISGENKSNFKKKLDFEAKNIKLDGLEGSTFKLTTTHLPPTTYHLPIPGSYHIYDSVAALAVATHLRLPTNQLANALITFQPAFGRVEKFNLGDGKLGIILLIKNPVGATEVFKMVASNLKKNDRLLLSLNDNLADGTDVSWIWDADFEELKTKNYELRTYASGTRANDLAVRLKYAGFNPKKILVEPNLKKAFREAKKDLKGRLFILPTYTAMLELQDILASSGLKRRYWEENE